MTFQPVAEPFPAAELYPAAELFLTAELSPAPEPLPTAGLYPDPERSVPAPDFYPDPECSLPAPEFSVPAPECFVPANALIVVAKKPAPGNTKTRLCPPLTFEQAAELYECFLRDTLDLMRRVPGVDRWIGYLPEVIRSSPSSNSLSGKEIDAELFPADDFDSIAYFKQLAPDMQLLRQQGETLGDRLDHLITQALHNGAVRAVVMDSDSPTLPPEYLSQAFEKLQENDVVLGPTRDGGYYLIGMNQPHPQLLKEVQMSTPNVLSDTLALAKKSNQKVSLLPEWYDIDTVAELSQLHAELASPGQQEVGVHTRRWLAAMEAVGR